MALKKVKENGKWATAKTWEPEGAPGENDDVEVPESKEVKIEAAAKCRSLVIRKKAKVTGASGLSVGGAAKPEIEFNGKQGWVLVVEAEAVISYTGEITFFSAVTAEFLFISVDKTITMKSTFRFTAGKLKQKVKQEENLATTGLITLMETQTWNTNSKRLECKEVTGGGGAKQAVLELGTSEVVITGGNEFNGFEAPSGEGTIFAGSEATIVFKGAGGSLLGGGTYGTVKVEVAKIGIRSSCTIKNLILNVAGLEGVKFGKNTTQTIENLEHNGKSGSLVKLESTEAGAEWKLHKAAGNVNTDFLELKDSHVDASPSWYAGTHSTNVSGNENWKFEAEPAGGTTPLAMMM